MTGKQYQKAIETLGLNQTTAAKVLGINARTSRRYAVIGPPGPVALALRCLLIMRRLGIEHEF